MASIVIDPTTSPKCVKLVCGVGESDVTFVASVIYKAWKDWFVLSDNSKYPPAFDSAGGNPVGVDSLDNVYFLQTANNWIFCPTTVEPEVIIRMDGNIFPDIVGAAMFGYSGVVANGHTHIETTVSTSARSIEQGVSGLNTAESAALLAIPTNPVLTTDPRLDNLDSAISAATASQTRVDKNTRRTITRRNNYG